MTRTIAQLRTRLARFYRDKSGAVLIYSAFMIPVILGVSGLSVDVGSWYANKRVAQAAADAGAIGASLEILRVNQSRDGSDITESEVTAIATKLAAVNGYDEDAGDEIEVNYPPKYGPYAGAEDSVEVIVRRPASVFLARILFDEDVTVAGRAVAAGQFDDSCVWALNKVKKNTLKVSGGAQVDLPCGILSNSNDPMESMGVDGGSCIRATNVRAAGGAAGDCYEPTAIEGVAQEGDPFANLMPPALGPCTNRRNIRVGSGETVNLREGVYCGRIDVSAGGTLNFGSGDYVLDGTGLNVAADGIVTGDGVSFFITEDSGQGDHINISANADVTLSAPTDGDMEGVLFYQDRNSPDNITHNISGGATMSLEGIIYFPNQNLQFSGGTEIDPVTTVIVADTIDFVGNTNIGDFDGSGILADPNLIEVRLVE
jgi:hypothetical protein